MSDVIRDECCICMEKNLALSAGADILNSVQMSCCGTRICNKCIDIMKKNAKTGKVFTCPICRSPGPNNEEEEFVRYLGIF